MAGNPLCTTESLVRGYPLVRQAWRTAAETQTTSPNPSRAIQRMSCFRGREINAACGWSWRVPKAGRLTRKAAKDVSSQSRAAQPWTRSQGVLWTNLFKTAACRANWRRENRAFDGSQHTVTPEGI